ncbi:MAG: cysteine--tRNA ligase [Cytophagales bacterium]|nr:MAG: cysteine--tRNA ligase [Cytophagales bacterium]
MQGILKVYNTLSRKKEIFEPLNSPFVGMYVCGPTVYSDPHLGHARSNINFDVIYRYLKFLGYKVRYVRNITDVGHLTDEVADSGEDRIQKKAKIEKIEPMEVVQQYTNSFHQMLKKINVLPPSIEPRASAHIPEQIKITQKIIENGYAYESNGSVYLDIQQYAAKFKYGELSGRNTEELLEGTRALEGQEEKKNPMDFALWKKASPEHLMRWDSPWSEGFPGWHLECTAMSTKYLGNQFDIHGGGMDLQFPHHESELAQSNSCFGCTPAKYWLHNNMVTINGQKMARSLGNFITVEELTTGNHVLLEKAYSPMTIRFFILQAHYRGTLDFSNEALSASTKAYKKIINGLKIIKTLKPDEGANESINSTLDAEIIKFCNDCFLGLNDDFNTAATIASLFNLLKKINSFNTNQSDINTIQKSTFELLQKTYIDIVENILGLVEEKTTNSSGFINGLLELYSDAKNQKDYAKVDKIRSYFKSEGLLIKDSKTLVDWQYEE